MRCRCCGFGVDRRDEGRLFVVGQELRVFVVGRRRRRGGGASRGYRAVFFFGVRRHVEVVQQGANRGVTVGGVDLHGFQYGALGTGRDVGIQLRWLGQGLRDAQDGLWGDDAGEEVVERGAERIDVGSGGEAGEAVAVVLLDGGKSFGEGEGGSAGLLVFDVVALADAEVDESCVVVLVDEDVAGLDVEVEDVFGVYELECAADLVDIFECTGFGDGLAVVEDGLEGSAVDALHGDVGRVVFLEDFEHVDDVGVVYFGKDAGFLYLPLAEFVEEHAAGLGMHADLHGGSVSEAVVFEEVFLDANRYGCFHGSEFTFDFGIPDT